ncbi:hypothetical protein [Asanoa siamensis]|uniref:Uncharacterized protein n=1 Tax=Asanoa siamensis TaxID=926357 RepID=A0ABQ4CMV0_9ACTN|nr:hypothetical protein [Asanoa siamensis]GIF72616.1 hypothetical protein Asi02nite_21340 [Asanoa siamensis]
MLRLIGYWDGPAAGPGWPDVRDFVDPGMTPERRRATVDYLRSGTPLAAAAGCSECRLCGARNACDELTDGVHFVWPGGLAHYVEAHDVALPDDVATVALAGPAGPVDVEELVRVMPDVDERWWRSLTGPGT